jgi:microcystin-dependent protein
MDNISLQKPCLLYPLPSVLSSKERLIGLLLLLSFLLFGVVQLEAQAPQQFSCQGVVRDMNDNLLSNATIGIQITIRQGSASGANIFREAHSAVTNEAGLFSIEIGTGQSMNGSLSAVNWEMGPFFIEQAIDLAGGTNYSLSSTTELLSVPFALHARSVDRATQVAVADTAAGVSNAGLLGLSIGTVMLFAGDNTTVPTGWLLCEGGAYNQNTYPALFSLIGTAYGAAPAGEFRVPDLRGRGPMGWDAAQTEFTALGQTGGSNTHTLAVSQLPVHNHGGAQLDGGHSHNVGTRGFLVSAVAAGNDFAPGGNGSAGSIAQFTKTAGSHTHTISSQGGGNTHNNLQPYYTINFIIKAN